MVTLDSEHSMLTAAGAAAATGARVFTATSSQGLLYALEMLYTVAGWRVPLVLVNVSRAVAAPITLEPDHNDVLAARDSGFLQIHAETCQEVLDSILMAYRLAEHADVLLPVLVNLDGFYLSFTREPVDVPEAGGGARVPAVVRPATRALLGLARHGAGRGGARQQRLRVLQVPDAARRRGGGGGARGRRGRVRGPLRPRLRRGRGLPAGRRRVGARHVELLQHRRQGGGRPSARTRAKRSACCACGCCGRSRMRRSPACCPAAAAWR